MTKISFSGRLFVWLTVLATVAILNVNFVVADEGHHMGDHEKDSSGVEMKQHTDSEEHSSEPQMNHSGHDLGDLPRNFEKPSQGVRELKINLKGPFCQKHPEEIRSALMKLSGVKAVEAFNGRKYVVIHYTGEETTPEQMGLTVSGVKGNGWRCSAVLPLQE